MCFRRAYSEPCAVVSGLFADAGRVIIRVPNWSQYTLVSCLCRRLARKPQHTEVRWGAHASIGAGSFMFEIRAASEEAFTQTC